MSTKNIIFDDKKLKKSDFYKNKKIFNIDYIDVNKVLVSKKEPYGTKNKLKYFFGYNDNDVIRPLCLRLPQMTGYAKKFSENATMCFRANKKHLLQNYNKIWKKTEKLMRIDFESKPVYGDDDKYVKIKIYANNMIPCKCLSIIMLDSVIKANKKYYPQTLLEECKYVQEKIKTENYIDEDLESDSGCNDETESDIQNDECDK